MDYLRLVQIDSLGVYWKVNAAFRKIKIKVQLYQQVVPSLRHIRRTVGYHRPIEFRVFMTDTLMLTQLQSMSFKGFKASVGPQSLELSDKKAYLSV
jgi:hypothetical protein